MPADQAGGLPAGAGGAREGRAGDPHQARYALDNTSSICRKGIVCFYFHSSNYDSGINGPNNYKDIKPKRSSFLKNLLVACYTLCK